MKRKSKRPRCVFLNPQITDLIVELDADERGFKRIIGGFKDLIDIIGFVLYGKVIFRVNR